MLKHFWNAKWQLKAQTPASLFLSPTLTPQGCWQPGTRGLTAVTWIERPSWDAKAPQGCEKRPRERCLRPVSLSTTNKHQRPQGTAVAAAQARLPTCPRSPRRQTARGPPDSSAAAGSPSREQHRDGSANRPNGLRADAHLRTAQWPPRPTRAPRAGTTRRTPGPTSAPTGSPAPERKLCSRRKFRLARGLRSGYWPSAEAVGCVAVLMWSVPAGPGLAFFPGALRVGLPFCLLPWRQVCKLGRGCWPWGLTLCKPLCEWRPEGVPRRARGHVWGDVGWSGGRNSAAAAGWTSHRGVPTCPHRRPGVEEKGWKRSPRGRAQCAGRKPEILISDPSFYGPWKWAYFSDLKSLLRYCEVKVRWVLFRS